MASYVSCSEGGEVAEKRGNAILGKQDLVLSWDECGTNRYYPCSYEYRIMINLLKIYRFEWGERDRLDVKRLLKLPDFDSV